MGVTKNLYVVSLCVLITNYTSGKPVLSLKRLLNTAHHCGGVLARQVQKYVHLALWRLHSGVCISVFLYQRMITVLEVCVSKQETTEGHPSAEVSFGWAAVTSVEEFADEYSALFAWNDRNVVPTRVVYYESSLLGFSLSSWLPGWVPYHRMCRRRLNNSENPSFLHCWLWQAAAYLLFLSSNWKGWQRSEEYA